MKQSPFRSRSSKLSSFTLVELLVVIAIIAILAALTLTAGSGVMAKASRSRAAAEIQGLSTALEGYKTDNGVYPLGYPSANPSVSINSSLQGPGTANGSYTLNPTAATYISGAQALYEALSGKTNYADTPVAGVKSYLPFTSKQLGNYKAAAGVYSTTGSTYIKDPWNYAYGYSTGDGANPQTFYPYTAGTTISTPGSSFDLWSTGGTTGVTASNPNPTNTWITNWK